MYEKILLSINIRDIVIFHCIRALPHQYPYFRQFVLHYGNLGIWTTYQMISHKP